MDWWLPEARKRATGRTTNNTHRLSFWRCETVKLGRAGGCTTL